MSAEFVRIVSKNDFTVRTLTLLFEDAGYTVTDDANKAELTVTDIASELDRIASGDSIYLAQRGAALPKGATVVLAKPVSWDELVSTADALASARARGSGIELRGDTLVWGGKSVKLTEREAKLFLFFKSSENKPVTREEMLCEVWGVGEKNTNLTDVYVNYLRKKLKTAFGADFISSVRVVGYVYREKEV